MQHPTLPAKRLPARVLAFLLIAGGALGIATAIMMGLASRPNQNPNVVPAILSGGLFAWGMVAGIALWRGTPGGYRWSRVVFALQLPVFTVSRVTYEFSTFFSLRVMLGNTTRHIGADIGSSCNLHLWPHPMGYLLGINMVALLALVYLTRATRVPAAGRPADTATLPALEEPGTLPV